MPWVTQLTCLVLLGLFFGLDRLVSPLFGKLLSELLEASLLLLLSQGSNLVRRLGEIGVIALTLLASLLACRNRWVSLRLGGVEGGLLVIAELLSTFVADKGPGTLTLRRGSNGRPCLVVVATGGGCCSS